MGLQGRVDDRGIRSLAIIIYRPKCAIEALQAQDQAAQILDEYGEEDESQSSKLRRDGTYIYGDDKITYYNPDLPDGPTIWDQADGNFDLVLLGGSLLFILCLCIVICVCRAVQETKNYAKNRVHQMKENEAERRRTEEIQRRIKVIENPEKDIGGLKLE